MRSGMIPNGEGHVDGWVEVVGIIVRSVSVCGNEWVAVI